MEATQLICSALKRSLGIEDFNIFSNNGKVAGQSVFHLHWHVTPRYANDHIRFELSLKDYPDDAMALYGQRIRDHINSTV
jgi:histidine triad (HIT) family protein